MKLKESEIKEVIKEILSELRIVKFSAEDMKTLHDKGQIEKDDVFYQYHEPVEEARGSINRQTHFPMKNKAWKQSRGSGRGMSWMNYDKGKIRLQVTKDGSKYSAWLAKIPNPSGKYMFDLTGLTKSHIETIKVLVQNTDNLSKVA